MEEALLNAEGLHDGAAHLLELLRIDVGHLEGEGHVPIPVVVAPMDELGDGDREMVGAAEDDVGLVIANPIEGNDGTVDFLFHDVGLGKRSGEKAVEILLVP